METEVSEMQLGSIPNCSATSTELCLLTLQSLSLGLHFDGVSFLPMRCVACVYLLKEVLFRIYVNFSLCGIFYQADSSTLSWKYRLEMSVIGT